MDDELRGQRVLVLGGSAASDSPPPASHGLAEPT